MRKYICLSNGIIALFFLTLVSCESVFIPDPIDPRLPKYTERGVNTAGAFVNQYVWKSVAEYGYDLGYFFGSPNKDFPFMKVFNIKDSIVLQFDGQIMKGQKVLTNSSITFHLRDLNIHSFSDLITLKNRKIQLDGVRNFGAFTRSDFYDPNYYPPCSATAGIGQIYFRNVIMNDSLNRAIISGTFGFTITNSNCGTTEVSYGRFDSRFDINSGFRIN